MKTIFLIRHSMKEDNDIDNSNEDAQELDAQTQLSSIGHDLADVLSRKDILKDIEEVWSSSYSRAIQTAKYLCDNRLTLHMSNSFDERYYGILDSSIDKEQFWINQFKDKNLKTSNGESQKEVRDRLDNMINYILKRSPNNNIAIVSHNAAILFYLLKYCDLISAEVPKKLTISYKGKILINNGIMKSPSIMKLEFDNNELKDIDYIEL